MKILVLIIVLLATIAPARAGIGGEEARKKMRTIDSLEQYDYDYAGYSPFEAEGEQLFNKENRALWMEEITYPFSTPFTQEWSREFKEKYTLDKVDFFNQFVDNQEYSLVLVKGPNIMRDLAYEVVVFRKIKGKYLVVRSYIEGGRFVEKSYRVIGDEEYNALKATLNKMADLAEKQKGDLHYADPELMDECMDNKEDTDEARFYCGVQVTSGLVIDNETDRHFYLYGYSGIYDPVHPRKVIYNRVREDEFEATFFRDVKWHTTYVEGETVADAY